MKIGSRSSILNSRFSIKGQVLIEFTFCMIIVFLMIFAIMKVVQWAGLDLVNRRVAHDEGLVVNVVQDYGNCTSFDAACEAISYPGDPACCLVWIPMAEGPMKQVDPYFYRPTKMNAIWDGT